MEQKTFINPKLVIESAQLKPGEVAWRSPSNLAIIKYWGKHGRQLPRNPSFSFTLDEAYTETRVAYSSKRGTEEQVEITFLFDGQPAPAFQERIHRYLCSILDVFPFLKQLHLDIESTNSFPHSAGIASSASALSALSLCLCSLEDRLFGTLEDDEAFRRKASFVARLGSGSACRSIYAKAAFWGAHGEVPDSSDAYALPMEEQLHPVFQTYQNDILLVSSATKSVSSSAGHELMTTHAFADSRFKSAYQRVHRLLPVLKRGDLEEFTRIAETEALTLHGLMMSSYPPYLLMHPNTIEILQRVQRFREETDTPLCFSLDAGPNPHLLYPESEKENVQLFIQEALLPFCEGEKHIADRVGEGPLELD